MAIQTTEELKNAYNELLEYEEECAKLRAIQDGQFSIQTEQPLHFWMSTSIAPLNAISV